MGNPTQRRELSLSIDSNEQELLHFVSEISLSEASNPGSSVLLQSTIHIPRDDAAEPGSGDPGAKVSHLNRLAEIYDLLAAAGVPRAEVTPSFIDGALPPAGNQASISEGLSTSSPPSPAPGDDGLPGPLVRPSRFADTMYETLLDQRVLPGDAVLSYGRVAVGGTFDRLHVGHQLLLAVSALICREGGFLYIGVTADRLLESKKYRELLQSFEEREEAVTGFVRRVRPDIAVQTGALTDPKEPTAAELDPDMEALVVSVETLAGGEAINRARRARGFRPLEIVTVPVIGIRKEDASEAAGENGAAQEAEERGFVAASHEKKLSSTELRYLDSLSRRPSEEPAE